MKKELHWYLQQMSENIFHYTDELITVTDTLQITTQMHGIRHLT